MSAVCPVIASDAGLVERLAAYVECQSQQIGLAAFQGGVWHGLPTALVSVLLVLYVAGIGYRLILHHHIDTASLVIAALRLGIVVALTTTFSAYSTLVYTVSTQGPAELAAVALAPVGLRAPSPTEASHAAAGYLESLAGPAQASPTPAPAPAPPPGVNPSAMPPVSAPAQASTPASSPAGSGRDLGSAVFMLSCVGFGLAARLAQAIALAAGPLFIAAALFDMSIGLFIGWLRALAALFLAQTGYAVSSALELAFLAKDMASQSQGAVDPGEPLLLGLFFLAAGAVITLVAVLAASALRRLDLTKHIGALAVPKTSLESLPAAQSPWPAPELRIEPPVSRAQRVTDAVGALASAEDQRRGGGRDVSGAPAAGAASMAATDSLAGAGPGLRRPGQLRASTGAAKRDLVS